MAKTRVILNHREMQTYLDGGHGVRELLRPAAERVLAAAKADPHDDTGAYEAGLEIQEDDTDRFVLRVVSTDWKGYLLEAKYGILSRALDHA